jgi:hypothetical protein
MLRVGFPPSLPDTVQKKYKMLFGAPKKKKKDKEKKNYDTTCTMV